MHVKIFHHGSNRLPTCSITFHICAEGGNGGKCFNRFVDLVFRKKLFDGFQDFRLHHRVDFGLIRARQRQILVKTTGIKISKKGVSSPFLLIFIPVVLHLSLSREHVAILLTSRYLTLSTFFLPQALQIKDNKIIFVFNFYLF